MKKRKSKIILMLAGVLLLSHAILFTSCNVEKTGKKQVEKENRKKTESKQQDSYCNIGQMNYMADGILHFDENEYGYSLSYYDNSSGRDGILCEDKTCYHDKTADSKCSARHSSGSGGMGIVGDKLYFFEQDEKTSGMMTLYQSDIMGNSRKKIFTIKKAGILADVFYHGDKIFFSYCEQDFDDIDSDNRVLHVSCYDVKTGQQKSLYDFASTQSMFQGITVKENMIYLSVTYNDASQDEILKHKNDASFEKRHRQYKIIGMDYETGKEKFTIDGEASNRVISVVQGKLFYSKEGKICCYDLDTLETRIILDKDATAIYSTSGKYVYYLYYEGKQGKGAYVYLQYDPVKDVWKTLGKSSRIFYEAIVGEYAYGSVVSASGNVEDVVWLSKKDFLQGNLEREKKYERIS